MPQVSDEIVKELYALYQESRAKSTVKNDQNLTKADIMKIAKFKNALLETPYDVLVAPSSKQAQVLRAQYLHYLAQMETDARQKIIEKMTHYFKGQFSDLKKIDIHDPHFMSKWNAFNEKLLRTPFSYLKATELNQEGVALQNYYVLLIVKQIKDGNHNEIKQNQSKQDLKLLLAHIKDVKVHETIARIISADQRIEPLAHRGATSDKHRNSNSPDTNMHKKAK